MTQWTDNKLSQKKQSDFSKNLSEKFSGTLGTSHEMTMMQLNSEQTNLSSSSKTDTESEQKSVDAHDEDPDFILTGKKKAEERQINEEDADESLTYWNALKNQPSSAWDILSGDPLGGVDSNQVLCKPKPKKSNPRPWIAFNDLNNSDDAPYENKPKPAIEIGLKFEF